MGRFVLDGGRVLWCVGRLRRVRSAKCLLLDGVGLGIIDHALCAIEKSTTDWPLACLSIVACGGVWGETRKSVRLRHGVHAPACAPREREALFAYLSGPPWWKAVDKLLVSCGLFFGMSTRCRVSVEMAWGGNSLGSVGG